MTAARDLLVNTRASILKSGTTMSGSVFTEHQKWADDIQTAIDIMDKAISDMMKVVNKQT